MPAKTLEELKLTRKIQQGHKGDFWISIPKRLAETRRLKAGKEAEWKIRSDGRLELTI